MDGESVEVVVAEKFDELEREVFEARRMLGLYAAYAPAEVHQRVRETYAGQQEEANV